MTKWEYTIIVLKQKKLDIQLDELGNLGWELCGYDFVSGTAIFKRPYKLGLELVKEDGSKETFLIR